jgi:hypothetical protein
MFVKRSVHWLILAAVLVMLLATPTIALAWSGGGYQGGCNGYYYQGRCCYQGYYPQSGCCYQGYYPQGGCSYQGYWNHPTYQRYWNYSWYQRGWYHPWYPRYGYGH